VYDKFLNEARKNKTLTYESQCAQVGLINSLKNNGLNFTLHSIISNGLVFNKSQHPTQSTDNLFDLQYYTAWKLGVWDELESLNEMRPSVELKSSFNKTFYDILKVTTESRNNCLLVDFNEKVGELISNCRNSLIDQMIEGNRKTSELTEKQAQLYFLKEISKFTSLLNDRGACDLKSVFSESVYGRFELKSFSNNTRQASSCGKKFFVLDDLLSIRLELAKVFINLKYGGLDDAQKGFFNEYNDCLYENLIENTINYKFFQVIRFNFYMNNSK
jgi:hypothetical protein